MNTFLLLVRRHNPEQNNWYKCGVGDMAYWKNRFGYQIIYPQGAFPRISISSCEIRILFLSAVLNKILLHGLRYKLRAHQELISDILGPIKDEIFSFYRLESTHSYKSPKYPMNDSQTYWIGYKNVFFGITKCTFLIRGCLSILAFT